MRVFFDSCFLDRPFDDQSQDKIRLEREALGMMLRRVELGDWLLVGAESLDIEVGRILDRERREALEEMLSLATEHIPLTAEVIGLARSFAPRQIAGMDALHLASAAVAGVETFFTVDDRLYRRARLAPPLIQPRVAMPLRWLESGSEESET